MASAKRFKIAAACTSDVAELEGSAARNTCSHLELCSSPAWLLSLAPDVAAAAPEDVCGTGELNICSAHSFPSCLLNALIAAATSLRFTSTSFKSPSVRSISQTALCTPSSLFLHALLQ